jgi:hypothetical protein
MRLSENEEDPGYSYIAENVHQGSDNGLFVVFPAKSCKELGALTT